MESSNDNVGGTVGTAPISKTIDASIYQCTVHCAIRRKPNMTALPGQDPAERVYKIGASLDSKVKGNLKGISGALEALLMPEIVGVSANDPTFRKSIEEYWSSISKVVPPDEVFLKEHEKGVEIKILVKVVGKTRQERFNALLKVEEKMEYLNTLLTTYNKDETPKPFATLEYESVSDFLLLNYCLKYARVANSFADIEKSPKISFYIFEKEVSVKNQLTLIELRKKAMQSYISLDDETRKINAILLMFGEKPASFETETDKLLKIDELYNRSTADMTRFVDFVQDSAWETKYLINAAITANKLRQLPNSSAVYYNDMLLGMNLEETVLFLNNDTKGKDIKENLLREVNTK